MAGGRGRGEGEPAEWAGCLGRDGDALGPDGGRVRRAPNALEHALYRDSVYAARMSPQQGILKTEEKSHVFTRITQSKAKGHETKLNTVPTERLAVKAHTGPSTLRDVGSGAEGRGAGSGTRSVQVTTRPLPFPSLRRPHLLQHRSLLQEALSLLPPSALLLPRLTPFRCVTSSGASSPGQPLLLGPLTWVCIWAPHSPGVGQGTSS